MREYWALLRNRPAYRALWAAELISITGDWFSLVAVSILVTQTETSGLSLATVLAAHLLPQALLAPLAGWLADRVDRRKLLMGGAVAEGALTLLMAVCAALGWVDAMQLLLLLRSGVAAVREPAAGASLPRLVSAEELPLANALGAATWSLTFVIGMALGGVASHVGPAAALAIDAATFGVATLVLRLLPNLPARSEEKTHGNTWASVMSDWSAAIGALQRSALRSSVLSTVAPAVAAGAAWVALNLSAQARPFAGSAALTLGVLQAVRGIGTGLGPFLVQRTLGLHRTSPWPAHAAALSAFAGSIGIALSGDAASACGAALFWGLGGGALWVITQTEIQSRSDDGMRGRLLALGGFGFTLGMSGSALLCGLLLDQGLPLLSLTATVVAFSAAIWLYIRKASHAEPAVPSQAMEVG